MFFLGFDGGKRSGAVRILSFPAAYVEDIDEGFTLTRRSRRQREHAWWGCAILGGGGQFPQGRQWRHRGKPASTFFRPPSSNWAEDQEGFKLADDYFTWRPGGSLLVVLPRPFHFQPLRSMRKEFPQGAGTTSSLHGQDGKFDVLDGRF